MEKERWRAYGKVAYDITIIFMLFVFWFILLLISIPLILVIIDFIGRL